MVTPGAAAPRFTLATPLQNENIWIIFIRKRKILNYSFQKWKNFSSFSNFTPFRKELINVTSKPKKKNTSFKVIYLLINVN